MALLGAIHERERLAPEECKSGNVDSDVSAARSGREVVKQAAAGVFVAQLIDFVVADHPRVLRGDGQIAISLLRGAGVRVLPERLVLAVDFDSGYRARAYISPQHELLIDGKAMVKTQAIDRGALKNREVPNLGVEAVKGAGQRGVGGDKRRSAA